MLSAFHGLSHLESLCPHLARHSAQSCTVWGLSPPQDSIPGSGTQGPGPQDQPIFLLPAPLTGAGNVFQERCEGVLGFWKPKPRGLFVLCSLFCLIPPKSGPRCSDGVRAKADFSWEEKSVNIFKTLSHLVGDGPSVTSAHCLLLAIYFTFSPPSPVLPPPCQ